MWNNYSTVSNKWGFQIVGGGKNLENLISRGVQIGGGMGWGGGIEKSTSRDEA